MIRRRLAASVVTALVLGLALPASATPPPEPDEWRLTLDSRPERECIQLEGEQSSGAVTESRPLRSPVILRVRNVCPSTLRLKVTSCSVRSCEGEGECPTLFCERSSPKLFNPFPRGLRRDTGVTGDASSNDDGSIADTSDASDVDATSTMDTSSLDDSGGDDATAGTDAFDTDSGVDARSDGMSDRLDESNSVPLRASDLRLSGEDLEERNSTIDIEFRWELGRVSDGTFRARDTGTFEATLDYTQPFPSRYEEGNRTGCGCAARKANSPQERGLPALLALVVGIAALRRSTRH